MTNSKLTALRGAIERFRADTAGGAVVYTALMMPILLGAVGLGSEIAVWHLQSRAMQTVADAAALAGAGEASRSPGDETMIEAATVADAAANGLNTATGDTIEIRWPPTTGVLIGDDRAVEVIVQRPALALFSTLFDDERRTIAARAVARRNSASCVMVLHPSDSAALKAAGNPQIYFPCGITVNSDAIDALVQSGFAQLRSDAYIEVVGGYSGANIFPTPTTGVQPLDDPLIDLPAPGPYACGDDGYSGGGKLTVNSPTTFDAWNEGNMDGILVFCQEVRLQSVIQFNPGIYVFEDALVANAGADISGTDVMWYFAPTAGNTITINGGASLNLVSPDSGMYAGVVVFQDQGSPMTTVSLTGGSQQYLDGIVYFPMGDVRYSGGLSDVYGSPTMLIVSKVDFSGNTFFGDPNLARAIRAPALASASLVE